mmetsp:Transcript_5055/g.14923  ORF Transcript_5055/g.14923 Transcript_5055/m.14923 type:complete len:219 (+) Transcript_5055:2398-3054(+)
MDSTAAAIALSAASVAGLMLSTESMDIKTLTSVATSTPVDRAAKTSRSACWSPLTSAASDRRAKSTRRRSATAFAVWARTPGAVASRASARSTTSIIIGTEVVVLQPSSPANATCSQDRIGKPSARDATCCFATSPAPRSTARIARRRASSNSWQPASPSSAGITERERAAVCTAPSASRTESVTVRCPAGKTASLEALAEGARMTTFVSLAVVKAKE